jgi:hypothetical protein
MNLNYSQTTGHVTDDTGSRLANGWAGHGAGKNNPTMQDVHNIGPLPQGKYNLSGWFNHPRLGPMVARLTQVEGETFGRDAFFIHGASKDPAKYGQESEGCIVLPRQERDKISILTPGPGHTITVTV